MSARKRASGKRGGAGELDLDRILKSPARDVEAPEGFRSGFVAIIGRPNVGKSTLLNRILGEKLAIVTRKPGTTRRRLLGVLNAEGAQAVFFDTPGLERPASKLGRFLLEEVKAACSGADLALFLTDDAEGEADESALALLEGARTPALLVINKVDLMKDKAKLLPVLAKCAAADGFRGAFPVSALKGDNVAALVEEIIRTLPEGPMYFSPDMTTDASEAALVEEFVREQAYRQLHREIPYAVAVKVREMERAEGSGLLRIEAEVCVERKSQRGILVGKGGGRIKRIGAASRKEIERRLGERIYLGLEVRLKPNWRQKDAALRELGYENARG